MPKKETHLTITSEIRYCGSFYIDTILYLCYHILKAYFLVILSFKTFYILENSCFYFTVKQKQDFHEHLRKLKKEVTWNM